MNQGSQSRATMRDVHSLSTELKVGIPSALAKGSMSFCQRYLARWWQFLLSPASEWGYLGHFTHGDFATKQTTAKIPVCVCMGGSCQSSVIINGDLARLVKRVQREMQHTLSYRQYLHLVSSVALQVPLPGSLGLQKCLHNEFCPMYKLNLTACVKQFKTRSRHQAQLCFILP